MGESTSNTCCSCDPEHNTNILNQNTIKYLAIFFMVLDHTAIVLISNQVLYDLFIGLGSFTFITMSYFLVEGFNYTHSKKKYALRLLLFAFISQFFYSITFVDDGLIFQFNQLNILFALFISFVMLWALSTIKSLPLKILIFIIACALCFYCDWSIVGPFYAILFKWAYNNRKKLYIAYGGALIILSSCYFAQPLFYGYEPEYSLSAYLIFMIGGILSAICILFLYNGKRDKSHPKFDKWFFYIFYPAHLLIIGLIRIILFV